MLFDHPVPATNFCFFNLEGALPSILVAHPGFSASILLQGAQLVRFAPRGEFNWLWLSEQEPFRRGQAVRGGIPVCWPWFGNPDRNPDPVRRHIRSHQAHGFARGVDWKLHSARESVHAVELSLVLDTAECTTDEWDGQARVIATFRLSSRALEVSLDTLNTGVETLHLSQALHSYFPTSDIHRTRIQGLSGRHYVDALDGWQNKTQQGPVVFRAETDRIYAVSGPLQLTTPAGVMRLEQSSSTAVIWNPWIDKAKRLSHFAPSDWRRMFCVETAHALADAVSVEAGARHAMNFNLSRL